MINKKHNDISGKIDFKSCVLEYELKLGVCMQ